MTKLNRSILETEAYYEPRIVQFGEGNFLRAFVDYAFHLLNKVNNEDLGILIVQPIEQGMVDVLNEQEGLFTLFLNGIENDQVIQEKHLITNILKGINPYADFEQYLKIAKIPSLEFVVSNTTEAGIAYDASDKISMRPPSSFPGKLTQFLYTRYQHFSGEASSGLTILPCELINYNGDNLRSIILQYAKLWKLEEGFIEWVNKRNSFHNTLVDRIVPGFPKDDLKQYQDQLPYEDRLMVTAEKFFLWVIEGDKKLKEKLPFTETLLDVKIVKDLQPYRTRKVWILNGAHTAMVPLGILYGRQTVKDTVEDPFSGEFIRQMLYSEVIPTLDLDPSELDGFARMVLDRFRNPFIRHELSSIALNSISKFKVRVLPSLVKFVEIKNRLPLRMTYAFACLICFYRGEWKGKKLPLNDSSAVLSFFSEIWKEKDLGEVVRSTLGNVAFWELHLQTIPGLADATIVALEEIELNGVEVGFYNFQKNFQSND